MEKIEDFARLIAIGLSRCTASELRMISDLLYPIDVVFELPKYNGDYFVDPNKPRKSTLNFITKATDCIRYSDDRRKLLREINRYIKSGNVKFQMIKRQTTYVDP